MSEIFFNLKFLRVLWLCLHHDDAAKVNAETFPSFSYIICPAVLSKYSALYINKVTFVHIYARQDAFACGLPVWLWIRVSCYSGVLPYLHGMTARRVRMRYEQNSCISRIVLL